MGVLNEKRCNTIKIPNNKPNIWISWYNLFGVDISLMPKTYNEWMSNIIKLNLNTLDIYNQYCDTHSDMPKYLKLMYNNIRDIHIILDEIFE